MKVAIVGGGLAGIAAAYTLLGDPSVTDLHLLEADGGYGGRASTDTPPSRISPLTGARSTSRTRPSIR